MPRRYTRIQSQEHAYPGMGDDKICMGDDRICMLLAYPGMGDNRRIACTRVYQHEADVHEIGDFVAFVLVLLT